MTLRRVRWTISSRMMRRRSFIEDSKRRERKNRKKSRQPEAANKEEIKGEENHSNSSRIEETKDLKITIEMKEAKEEVVVIIEVEEEE